MLSNHNIFLLKLMKHSFIKQLISVRHCAGSVKDRGAAFRKEGAAFRKEEPKGRTCRIKKLTEVHELSS